MYEYAVGKKLLNLGYVTGAVIEWDVALGGDDKWVGEVSEYSHDTCDKRVYSVVADVKCIEDESSGLER